MLFRCDEDTESAVLSYGTKGGKQTFAADESDLVFAGIADIPI